MEKLKENYVEQFSVRWVGRVCGKYFWKREVLSLEWKKVGVMDGDGGNDWRDEFR